MKEFFIMRHKRLFKKYFKHSYLHFALSLFRLFEPSTPKEMLKKFFLLFFILQSCSCMKWINWSVDKGEVPPNAVLAGTESDNQIYVIRGRYADGLYPGKFMPEIKKAFATYNRKDIPLKRFEVRIKYFFAFKFIFFFLRFSLQITTFLGAKIPRMEER